MKQTIAEKIISAHCGKPVAAGDTVVASVDLAMATDGSGPLSIQLFREMGFSKVWDPGKVLMVLDHYVPCPNDKLPKPGCGRFNGRRCILLIRIRCHECLVEHSFVYFGSWATRKISRYLMIFFHLSPICK